MRRIDTLWIPAPLRSGAASAPRFLQSRAYTLGLALVMSLGLITGCGGGSPKEQPKNKLIPPVVVANPSVAPATPKSESPKPAKPGKALATAKVVQLPPGTDPNSVFDISAINQPMEVGPRIANPLEQFIVEAGRPGVDSTQMIVAAVEPVAKQTPKAGFTLPAGFVPLPDAGYSPDGLPLRIRCEKVGSVLALVPGGVARIGTNAGPSECQPEISVHVDTFYMEVFEVTVPQFEIYRQDQKEKKKPVPTTLNPAAPPRHPVLGVAWGNAQFYARWAGMDLPTEAQFEKAARGPNNLRTPWGDSRAIWPNNRTPETLTIVGAYAGDMSPYGIYDLAGNAREWCSDQYSDHAHREAIGTSGQVPHNWSGPKKASMANARLVKGNGPDWSAWHRQGREVGKGYPDVGFRCVLHIANAESKAGD